MSFEVVQASLSADLTDGGTFTISYPENTDAGAYFGAVGHKIATGPGDVYVSPDNFTVSFGTSNITITEVDMLLPADTKLYIQLEKRGENDGDPTPDESIASVYPASVVTVNLGAPDTLDADGVCQAQDRTGAGVLVLDGALVSGGVATFDVPRNVTVDSTSGTNAAVLTITGTDVHGNVVVENIILNNQTEVAGKKAFKTVTGVSASGTCDEVFVGTGDVLGLPVFLPKAGFVLVELEDGAAPTGGTFVVGVDTVATATTGDVRGTYDPNSACNGSKVFEIIMALEEPAYKGRSQFAG